MRTGHYGHLQPSASPQGQQHHTAASIQTSSTGQQLLQGGRADRALCVCISPCQTKRPRGTSSVTLSFRANSWAWPPHWYPSHCCSPRAVLCLQHTCSGQEEEQELILFFHACDPITTQPRDSSIHILTRCRRKTFSLPCSPQSGAFSYRFIPN